jgi:hypothetical protein
MYKSSRETQRDRGVPGGLRGRRAQWHHRMAPKVREEKRRREEKRVKERHEQ